jgi:zinc/manganese transport system ATP-binding protein
MPQKAAIDWSFPINVEQMVKLGQPSRPASASSQSVDSLLEQVGMNGMGSRRLNQLSGGQQQRVLLARALMQNASVLLLDEPCSAIDPPTRAHLLQVMRQQADRGQTLLVSSHDWGKALDSYDRVLVINKRLVADGTPSEVRSTITDMDGMMGDCCA